MKKKIGVTRPGRLLQSARQRFQVLTHPRFPFSYRNKAGFACSLRLEALFLVGRRGFQGFQEISSISGISRLLVLVAAGETACGRGRLPANNLGLRYSCFSYYTGSVTIVLLLLLPVYTIQTSSHCRFRKVGTISRAYSGASVSTALATLPVLFFV